MRVVFNALQAGNRSGTGQYVERLTEWLPEVAGEVEIITVWPSHLVAPPVSNKVMMRPGKHVGRLFQDQVGLRRIPADLIHYPANIGNCVDTKPQVITIHDLSFMRHPEWFSKNRAMYYQYATQASAHRACRIIVDSQSTALDVEEFMHITRDRIDVVPLGVDDFFSPATQEEQARVCRKYGVPDQFFLYVGTLEPRKNIPRIIDAWDWTAAEHGYDLVIAGRTGWKCGAIQLMADQATYGERIHFPGYIAEDDLPALLSAARGFIWPSLWEGFGLPPLNAMACGTPVITSSTSSLPELAGNAALLVNPCEIEPLVAAIRVLATDETEHARLRAAGLERAKLFTWEQTARLTVASYRQCLAS